jgi:hypothetical protein
MKVWFEAILEPVDESQQCCKCFKFLSQSNHVFGEFELRSGGLPNCDELHPNPTGKVMCPDCAKKILV